MNKKRKEELSAIIIIEWILDVIMDEMEWLMESYTSLLSNSAVI